MKKRLDSTLKFQSWRITKLKSYSGQEGRRFPFFLFSASLLKILPQTVSLGYLIQASNLTIIAPAL